MSIDNRLLRALPDRDFAELQPHLEEHELPHGSVLELPGKPVQQAHFFDRGFVSIMIHVGDRTMEIGLVGREGMLGLPAVMGTEIGLYRALAREDVLVRSVSVDVLRQFMGRRRAAGAILLRFVQVGVAQMAHMAFANTYLTISQRLARWLLMAHDRVEGDAIRVTHGVLSDALGVQRSGITLGLRELQDAQAVRTSHRTITVVDRAKLMMHAMGSYGPAERAYKTLLGSEISKR